MDSNILAALIGAGASAIIPLGAWTARKLSGKQYMTKEACNATHQYMKKECERCQTEHQKSVEDLENTLLKAQEANSREMLKIRKLLVTIALHNEVPEDKLAEFLV